MHYLGHIVSDAGISPDPAKIDVVRNWPAPANIKQLQSFLGMANYYNRFIEHYAHKAKPLTDLLGAGVTWAWGPAQI